MPQPSLIDSLMTDANHPKPATTRPRPLSPHLQVYRLPLSALTSIAHRLSGVALTAGAFVLAIWLYAAASSETCFDCMREVLASPIGLVALAGWTLAFYYHLCAGIRHLAWDAGIGFEKERYQFTNWVVIGAALVMTFCTLTLTHPFFAFLKGM